VLFLVTDISSTATMVPTVGRGLLWHFECPQLPLFNKQVQKLHISTRMAGMEGRQEDESNDMLSSSLCMVTLQMGLLPVALYNLVSERKVLANVSNIVMGP
jgi:hypothetical protein